MDIDLTAPSEGAAVVVVVVSGGGGVLLNQHHQQPHLHRGMGHTLMTY